MLTIGIDLGGTKLAGALVDSSGAVVAERRRSQPLGGYHAALDAVAETIAELEAVAWERHATVDASGVALAGYLDADRRIVTRANILGWRDEPVLDDLTTRVSTPVGLLNDADAAAWGEYVHGAGIGSKSLLLATLGTGVGGGVVIGGRLLTGGTGVGCELGHLVVEYGGLACACGARGCLEMYASGLALGRIATAICLDDHGSAELLIAQAGGEGATITAEHVVAAARLGDGGARAALKQAADWLGRGLAQATAVLDPGLILLGGGVSSAGELLLELTRRSYVANLGASNGRSIAPIELASLGPAAGVIGAAAYARAWTSNRGAGQPL